MAYQLQLPVRRTRLVLAILLLASLIPAVSSLAIRFSGSVQWADTGRKISGALVKTWDNDPVGRQLMAQGYTSRTGAYSFASADRTWDTCCFSATRPDLIYEVFIGGVLWLTTDERPNIATDQRALLAVERTNVSGRVTWSGSGAGAPVADATVRLYDEDPVGREVMGSATTDDAGNYAISYNPLRQWDTCCGGATAPDLIVDVILGSRRWAQTAEVSNSRGARRINIQVPRIQVSGRVLWGETCRGAAGLGVHIRDNDPISSQVMASGTAAEDGRYAFNVSPRNDGSPWDTCCGSDVAPDIYAEFRWASRVVGFTPEASNRASTAPLAQGTWSVWRGDPPRVSGAPLVALYNLWGGPMDDVSVEEFNDCARPYLVVTLRVNYQNDNDMSAERFARLRGLATRGIQDNWSRFGDRAVTMPGGRRYDVYVQVVEDPEAEDIELEYYDSVVEECERSNNWIYWDPSLKYNEGCFKFRFPPAAHGDLWRQAADGKFMNTAAHEWGHSILYYASPRRLGSSGSATGLLWSLTHKGSTSIDQDALPSAPFVPATGDWDVMPYYKNYTVESYGRSHATEEDVKALVALAKKKHVKLTTCGPCRTPPRPPTSPLPAPGAYDTLPADIPELIRQSPTPGSPPSPSPNKASPSPSPTKPSQSPSQTPSPPTKPSPSPSPSPTKPSPSPSPANSPSPAKPSPSPSPSPSPDKSSPNPNLMAPPPPDKKSRRKSLRRRSA